MPRFLKSTMVIILPALLMAALTLGAKPSYAQEWAINKQLSRITFELTTSGGTLAGEFEQFRAEIRFDPDHLDITEISAAIDMNTVNTGQPQANEALLTKEWFDVQTYPAAGFRVTSIKEGDVDRTYVLQGELTIKGHTKPILIPFTLNIDQGEAEFTGETEINRQNFAVGPSGSSGGTAVGDRVKIKLNLLATRLDN